MSVTTTDNPITLNLRQALGDYEVHITGDSSDQQENVTAPNTSNAASIVANPASWPQDYSRVPPYRPINHNLSWDERPHGSNVVETVFITTMFTGVALDAGMAQLWGRTGGKLFKTVFRYAIGGEW